MQPQPADSDGEAMHPSTTGMPRRVSVKAAEGERATVVVTVVQGWVWLSLAPMLTWEAIMEPRTVDEVVRVLEVAKEEAERMGMPSKRSPRHDGAAVREIGRGRPIPS